MPIIQDIKNDIREAKKLRLPWWGLLSWMAACGLVEWLLFDLGKMNLALPTLNSVAVVGFAIALKRKLGRHVWFWGIMAAIAALHIPLVLLVPWGTRWVPALAIAVIDSADLITILVILAVVGRFLEEPKVTDD